MQASLQQAIELEQQRIDTEHLLLGILTQGDGVPIRVLATLGVDADALRRSVLERTA